ncbi:hypothetical protein VTO73DRAFT_6773 [Trametes versicolor]
MALIPVCAKHASRFGMRSARRTAFSTSASLRVDAHKRTLHGVVRALQDGSQTPSPTLLEKEFSLADRVAMVTGANRGLGLEGALALAEAGARVVYCIDIADAPSSDWSRVQEFVSRMRGTREGGRLQYVHGDVANQEQMWKIGKMIGDREGRMDACLAAAGIMCDPNDTLYMSEKTLQKVLNVNLKGVLFTAQAAGQQMERFGNGGSIVLVASIGGHVSVNLGVTPYEIAKSGVHQMARSLACELAPKGIRANTISPGYFQSPMLDQLFKERPDWGHILTNANPMKRVGEGRELRGAIVWLASDASSFCTGSEYHYTTLQSEDCASATRGVNRILEDGINTPCPMPSDFSLADKVALVSGGHRGLGLEGALALAEAGARAVYCVDINNAPDAEWTMVQQYVSRLRGPDGEARRLEYICGDTRDQERMWQIGKTIGDREGRMDICFAAAGITGEVVQSLHLPEKELQQVLDVNLKGVLFTAQAAGQQMERFDNGGSIIMVASIAGMITVNLGLTSYEIAKGSVIQLARSLACEIAPKRIRVNTISPGITRTRMVENLHMERLDLVEMLESRNAMKRIGSPHEMGGTVAWLASDASSFVTGSNIVVDGGHCAC